MAFSICTVSAGAKEYCGGETKDEKWLTKYGYGATVQYVKDVRGGGTTHGSIYASYTRGAGVRAHTNASGSCRYHYSRVVSGGRSSEGDRTKNYWMSTSGIISLKNKSARFEGWYVY